MDAPDKHPSSELQVVGEADRRALEDQEAAEHAAAAQKRTRRQPVEKAAAGDQTTDAPEDPS